MINVGLTLIQGVTVVIVAGPDKTGRLRVL